ncbi:hypothetical protein LEAN103870_16040 [Legionella anisa]|nr:hypothetical protein Lani_1395 [Legionella anisa]
MVSSYRLAMHSDHGLNASLLISFDPSESSLIITIFQYVDYLNHYNIKINLEFYYVKKVYWQNILLYVLTHLVNQLVAANST